MVLFFISYTIKVSIVERFRCIYYLILNKNWFLYQKVIKISKWNIIQFIWILNFWVKILNGWITFFSIWMNSDAINKFETAVWHGSMMKHQPSWERCKVFCIPGWIGYCFRIVGYYCFGNFNVHSLFYRVFGGQNVVNFLFAFCFNFTHSKMFLKLLNVFRLKVLFFEILKKRDLLKHSKTNFLGINYAYVLLGRSFENPWNYPNIFENLI